MRGVAYPLPALAVSVAVAGCTALFGIDRPYQVDCYHDADCDSGVCADYRCAAAACDDGVANGSESDVDCGGPACAPCPDGRGCRADRDCEGGACAVAGTCCTPPCALWSGGFGDEKEQIAGAVAADVAGDVLWTGSYHGGLDLGGEPLVSKGASFDAFVAKLDPGGHPLWRLGIGDVELDYGLAVAGDAAGNVIAAGQFMGDIHLGDTTLSSAGGLGHYNVFVVKLDTAGTPLWSRSFGDEHDTYLRGLAVDAAGNILLTGYFDGEVDFGKGPMKNAGLGDPDPLNDMFLAKLDPGGGCVYSRSFGGAGKQEANGIVVGRFEQAIDFGDGTAPLACGGDMDAFVAKVDAQGVTAWSRAFGGPHYQDAEGVAVGAGGESVLTGAFYLEIEAPGVTAPLAQSESLDAFVIALDAGGGLRWVRPFGTAAEDIGYGAAIDAGGNAIVTGLFSPGTMHLGDFTLSLDGAAKDRNTWIAKIDPDGRFLWAKGFATHSGDHPHVGVTPFGQPLLTGDYGQAIDFGQGALPLSTHVSNQNIFLVGFAP
jgi:hypothetical protein